MKKYLLIVLTLFSGLFLVSCNKTVNDGEQIDFGDQYAKKSVIRVWIDDEEGEYMEAVIKEFNKVYPNIIVEHQHKGSVDSREHLKTFGPSGNGADVFQFPHDHMAQAVLEDLVLPLPSAVASRLEARMHEVAIDIGTLHYDEDTGSFDPSNSNAIKGLYGVPMSIEAVGLFYNKDLVDGEPATTYEQIIEEGKLWNAVKLENGQTRQESGLAYLGTTSHWADSYFMQHIYSAFDFTPFGKDLNDPSAVGFNKLEAALTWLTGDFKDITTGTGTPDSGPGGEKFESKEIPYMIGGPWNHEAFIDKGVNYGVAPLPSINGVETKPFTGAMMAAVYKYSDNSEDAIKFVEFLGSNEAMELQFKMKNKLPALKAELLDQIDGVLQDEKLMAMSLQLENAVPMPTIPQVQSYWGPGEAMIKSVWQGSTTVAAAVVEAETSYRTLEGLASGN